MRPYYRRSGVTIYQGDSISTLRTMPDESVQMCVTSPPYWGLRDYGVKGQLGLESTPEAYVAGMVALFREVRRVLKDDGVLWLNLGDSYAGSGMTGGTKSKEGGAGRMARMFHGNRRDTVPGLKPKDLVGIPWRVAFALQADGWYLRSDIIWHKPNPMPESVTDRPTKSHEYLFLLAKSERYFYDAAAIKTDGSMQRSGNTQHKYVNGQQLHQTKSGFLKMRARVYPKVNRRTVWSITTKPFKGAHFATFPPKLIEPCILAGSRPGDVVLDPFSGAATTGLVAQQHDRKYLGIELNAEYCDMAIDRLNLKPSRAQAA